MMLNERLFRGIDLEGEFDRREGPGECPRLGGNSLRGVGPTSMPREFRGEGVLWTAPRSSDSRATPYLPRNPLVGVG